MGCVLLLDAGTRLLGRHHERQVLQLARVDHHWDEQGRDLMTPHICGVAEIRDGKISAFRDFYDVVCYHQTRSEIQQGFDLASFREAQVIGSK